jgi:hypothetical protein
MQSSAYSGRDDRPGKVVSEEEHGKSAIARDPSFDPVRVETTTADGKDA